MLITEIDQDLKQAIKAKDEITVSALRNLKAEIQNVKISKQHDLSIDETLEVIRKKVKQHKDSIESFRAGNRNDLVSTEEQQMAVLQKYLPAQMSQDQVRELVKKTITELAATQKDFGKVMKEVLIKAAGQTDGSIVSKIVKEILK